MLLYKLCGHLAINFSLTVNVISGTYCYVRFSCQVTSIPLHHPSKYLIACCCRISSDGDAAAQGATLDTVYDGHWFVISSFDLISGGVFLPSGGRFEAEASRCFLLSSRTLEM